METGRLFLRASSAQRSPVLNPHTLHRGEQVCCVKIHLVVSPVAFAIDGKLPQTARR